MFGLPVAAPQDLPATIVSRVERHFPDFSASLIWQIGCATTRDIPSSRTEESTRQAQAERIKQNAPVLQQALEHYRSGRHPYTRQRHRVQRGSAHYAATSYLRGIAVRLRVQAGTDRIHRQKIAADFVLSQVYAGGILHKHPTTLSHHVTDNFSYALTTSLSSGSANNRFLEGLLVTARHRPEIVDRVVQYPIRGLLGNAQLKRQRLRWRARVLKRILARQAIGRTLMQRLPKHSAFADLHFLLYALPHTNQADRRALHELLRRKDLDRAGLLGRTHGRTLLREAGGRGSQRRRR